MEPVIKDPVATVRGDASLESRSALAATEHRKACALTGMPATLKPPWVQGIGIKASTLLSLYWAWICLTQASSRSEYQIVLRSPQPCKKLGEGRGVKSKGCCLGRLEKL